MSRSTLDTAVLTYLSLTGLSPSLAGLSRTVLLDASVTCAVRTPKCTHLGLGSSAFARRYLRNHCCFLFLSLLRCFSSGGSRLHTMDSCTVAAGFLQQVSPFRDPRITGYLLLPAAYRSLSRLSSALSAKASTLRSFCLTASCPLAYGHAAGHDSLHSNEFMFCMLSHARFFVDTDLLPPRREPRA